MHPISFPLAALTGIGLGVTLFGVGVSTAATLPILWSGVAVVAVLSAFVWPHAHVRTVLILALLFTFGALRGFSENAVLESSPASFSGSGVVARYPEQRIATQVLWLRTDVGGALLRITTDTAPRYAYGDWLSVRCSRLDNGACFFPEIHRFGGGYGNPLITRLATLRLRIATVLGTVLPEPHASFLVAMVLGDRGSIPESVDTLFLETGTSHLVAISGMNMVIIAEFLWILLGIFPLARRTRTIVAFCVLTLFTMLVGAPASAVRGFVFASALYGSQALGRPRHPGMLVAFAAALMLLVRPSWIANLGFQLSFLATVGILFVAPLIDALARILVTRVRAFRRCITFVVSLWGRMTGCLDASVPLLRGIHERIALLPRSVWRLFLVSFAAIITTTPLVAAFFGRISVIGILANLVAVPLTSFILIVGLIAAFILLFVPFVRPIFAVILAALVETLFTTLRWMTQFPLTTISVTPIRASTLYVLYALFFVFVAYLWMVIPRSVRMRALLERDSSSPVSLL